MEKQQFPLQVYIENAGDKTTGGFTMPMPTTSEALQPFLDAIGIETLQDVKIVDIRSDIDSLGTVLLDVLPASPYPLSELNYLAGKVSEFTGDEPERFAAAIEIRGDRCGSLASIINLTENLDRYNLQPAYDENMYGEFLIEIAQDEFAYLLSGLVRLNNLTGNDFVRHIARLESCVDSAAYARMVIHEEGGVFTDKGYLTEDGAFRTVYRGVEDIPVKYRCVVPPKHKRAPQEKPSIRDQLRKDRAKIKVRKIEQNNKSKSGPER